jgi:septum formation protein
MWPLPIILASASPRRQELLCYIADNFTCESADIDETPIENESALCLVERLASAKAQAISLSNNKALIVGSDTVIALDNIILGKPKGYDDFACMMRMLSNRQHEVYTGVSVLNTASMRFVKQVVVTQVTMGEISSASALDYWQTGEPADKAGGYAIQGIGGRYVKSINGSFSAVVGLPVYETKLLLLQAIE